MKAFVALAVAAALCMPAAFAQSESQIQAKVRKALGGSQFKDVQASVQGGIVTLTGSVNLYQAKLNAERKVRHVKGIDAIRDEIQVDGPEIPDSQLQAKLQQAIAYGLLGYVPVAFQTITVQVRNGVVLVGGHAAGPIAADDALAIVQNTKGVKDVIDDLQVDPTSLMDEQIRWAEYRAIYGQPQLNRYAIVPEQPIRIQVANGHVTLLGVVDSQADKNVAGIAANNVPNVFSVTNDLEVAGAPTENSPQ